MTSAYTPLGPFVDGGAPYLSAATFNHFEAALQSVGAVAAPAPTGIAATDTAALTTAISNAQAAGQSLQLLSGTYKLSTGLTWDLTLGSLTGTAGTVIDATAMTSGAAITISTSSGATGVAHRAAKYTVGGFELTGPDTDATTVDAFSITNAANGTDQGTIAHVFTYGFRDVLFYGNQTWCVTALKVVAGHFHRYGVYMPPSTNAGENQNFYSCTWYSSSGNAGGTATAVKITGNAEANFYACSFDYNGYEASIEAGTARFYGCHFENSGTNNLVRVQQGVTSSARTIVEFHSSSWNLTETTGTGRACVEIMSGSLSKVHVTWFGGSFSSSNQPYRLYINNSTAAPRIRHDGVYLDTTGTSSNGIIGDETNILVAGGFEGPATFGTAPSYAQWAHGGTVTYTIDSGNPRSGTYAMKMVGAAGGATTAASQYFAITPTLTPYTVIAWMACTAYTSGSVSFRAQWLAADKTTVLRTDNVGQTSGAVTAVQGYKPYVGTFVPPAGAAFGNVNFYCSSDFSGTVYVDDVAVWAV